MNLRSDHCTFRDRGQRRLKLADLLRCQDLEGHAASLPEVNCQPICLEGGLGGIDMELTDALNEPLRPCLKQQAA